MPQMRRKDRQLSPQDARTVLQQSEYGFLATVNADGSPYCVPMSGALVGDVLYFHGARAGQKLDNLRNDSRACFSAVLNAQNMAAEFTFVYASCVATGTLREITDEAGRMAAIRAICQKYSADFVDTDAYTRTLKALPAVAVFALEIETLTGKANKGRLPKEA